VCCHSLDPADGYHLDGKVLEVAEFARLLQVMLEPCWAGLKSCQESAVFVRATYIGYFDAGAEGRDAEYRGIQGSWA
jgi:hypothetical protein